MFWFLLGVAIVVFGGSVIVAIVRLLLAIVAWVFQLVLLSSATINNEIFLK